MLTLLPLALVGLSGPSMWNGDAAAAVSAAQAVEGTGASWARVNARLDVWSAPDDATPRGPLKLTYFQAYDRIVDELTSHGVQVYMLINAESVPGGGDPDSDDFVNRYTTAAVKIIDHFKDRVRVYEIFNEPNNWRAGTQQPAISPYHLAKLLQQIYLAAKHDGGRNQDPCDQVSIVSGGLFSFDGTDASDYLTQVYQQGRSMLAWDWMRANVGTYPLDGIGYHVYVGQSSSATVASVQAGIAKNLSGIEAAIDAQEVAGSSKPIWLSEFGWTTDQVSAQQQADFLTASYQQLAGDGRVVSGFWFSYQDFPGGNYGLYSGKGLSQADRHPLVYGAFTQAAQDWLPVHNATFLSTDLPASLGAGETRLITVQVQNLGTLSWSEAGHVRLGAGPGCPTSAAANQLALEPGSAGGYQHSITDARLFLDGAALIGNDQTASFSFSVTAPATPGQFVLALRMVQDGVTWFGDSFAQSVMVVDGSAGSPNGDGPGTAGGTGKADGIPNTNGGANGASGCEIAQNPRPAPLFVLAVLLLVPVRRLRPHWERLHQNRCQPGVSRPE
jgi:hypothetical protein